MGVFLLIIVVILLGYVEYRNMKLDKFKALNVGEVVYSYTDDCNGTILKLYVRSAQLRLSDGRVVVRNYKEVQL